MNVSEIIDTTEIDLGLEDNQLTFSRFSNNGVDSQIYVISWRKFFLWNFLTLFLVIESSLLYREEIPCPQSVFRQYKFNKNEFHHLNVPRVGTVAVFDVFDCTLKCLSNPLCFSVNLAAFKGAHGKLWCELLSSDKFRNSTEYKGNISFHHFAMVVRNVVLFF